MAPHSATQLANPGFPFAMAKELHRGLPWERT